MDRTILILSDFNISSLAAVLGSQWDGTVQAIGLSDGVQAIYNPLHPCWEHDYDAIVIWTSVQGVFPFFKKLMAFEPVDDDALRAERDVYTVALKRIAESAQTLIHISWTIDSDFGGWDMLDFKPELGIRHRLQQFNVELCEVIGTLSNAFVLDAAAWIQAAGERAFDDRLWFMAKIPYAPTIFKAACNDIMSTLDGIDGRARKVIIVDLDNTLWDGIVGDAGWENLRIGGHDPVGEALQLFQHRLKNLTNRGIILAIVSKNEEGVALDAIDKHPEMVLRREDFSGWRINWQDKAQNIIDLMADLNLGMDSAVFIDDNPVERARVAESLPDVLVPDWPVDKLLYPRALMKLRCFASPYVTSEDRKRAELYTAEATRGNLRTTVNDPIDWLKSLNTHVVASPLSKETLNRAVQLFNKTNQMNLATRRLTDVQLMEWLHGGDREMWTFRVSDRFGESGLTALASLEYEGDEVRLVDFLLSCRVMGRGVEDVVLGLMIKLAAKRHSQDLVIECLPTEKNTPCQTFFRSAGLKETGSLTFAWDLRQTYGLPDYIDCDVTEGR